VSVGNRRSASGAAEWLSTCRSVTASSSRSPSKLGTPPRCARLVVEIVGGRRSLQADFRYFLVEMPGSAPAYKDRMRRASNANGRHPAQSSRCSCGRVSASPEQAWVHSAATPVAGFSALCRLRDHSYVVGSARHAPGHSSDATGSQGRRGGVLCGQQPGISEDSTFSNLREVIMTMSEYEERFRPPAPSLHQTFEDVRGLNRGRGSRRLWVVAALIGGMTITAKAALHHSTHASGSQVSKSGIQTCDFIHR